MTKQSKPNNGRGTHPLDAPHRLDYEIECLYEHKNKPHGKTTSRVPLHRCPHCGSPRIRTTIRREPIEKTIVIRRNGNETEPKPEPHEQKPIPETPRPELTWMEKRIFGLLEAQPVVTKDELRERIWRGEVKDANIHAAISRLRGKIEDKIHMDQKAGGYRLVGNG